MKNNNALLSTIYDFFKGFILGFVCVAAPGVSGGTIAVMLGVFTKIIDSGSALFHNFFKKSWWSAVGFLCILVIGAVLGAYIGSIAVTFTFEKYPLAVTMLLVGLIIGSIPMLCKNVPASEYKKPSNIILMSIIFILTMVYTFAIQASSNVTFVDMKVIDYIVLALMGVITTATMIIPGISGNIFLAAFGYWAPLNAILASITSTPIKQNLPILITFVIGCAIGAILMISLIKILLNKLANKTNLAILTFVVASPIIMIKICVIDNSNFVFNYKELLIGSLLTIVGIAISLLIGFYSKKNAKEGV